MEAGRPFREAYADIQAGDAVLRWLDQLAALSAANTENLANSGLNKEDFIPSCVQAWREGNFCWFPLWLSDLGRHFCDSLCLALMGKTAALAPGIVIVFKLKRKEEWYWQVLPLYYKGKIFPETLIRFFLRIYYYLNVNHVTSRYKGVWKGERRLRMSFGQSADSDLVDMEISKQIYFQETKSIGHGWMELLVPSPCLFFLLLIMFSNGEAAEGM